MINFKLLVEEQLDELLGALGGAAAGLAVGVKTRSFKKGLAAGAVVGLAIKHRKAIAQKAREATGATTRGAGRQVQKRHEERRDANAEVRAAKRNTQTQQRASEIKREAKTKAMQRDKLHKQQEDKKRARLGLN